MNLKINDKRFVVIGASKGIGKAIAYRLLKEGAKVAITARGKKELKKTTDKMVSQFGSERILQFCSDCTSKIELSKVKDKIVEVWNGVDAVVANLGDGRSVPEPIPNYDQWEKTWKINFESALLASRVFLPLLEKSKGCLLFTSSIAGVEAIGAPVDYSTAKSALNAFAKNLSRKVAPDVRVNVIAPGNIYFPGSSWDEKLSKDSKSVKNILKNIVPMQRFGTPEELADSVAFLCSDRAAFITGTILRVDGGQTVSL